MKFGIGFEIDFVESFRAFTNEEKLIMKDLID
jgi:hypothetical protein